MGQGPSETPEILGIDECLDIRDSPDETATFRILDVSANRAREAMRVIEDYCRFALNDQILSRETKELRHLLADAMGGVCNLLPARDTVGDVGTTVTTAGERDRESPFDVARVNLKRLQESLRSLEEFGKLTRPPIGAEIEAIRYRTYTLEKAIAAGQSARVQLASARLYLLVTGSACATSLDFLVSEAAAGGVDVFQLREKNLTDSELLTKARRMRSLTRKAGALFIINDRPDIARLAEADGVHLGQEDMSVADARRIVGPNALIGVSTHSADQLRMAIMAGADYVGIGPVYPSRTKQFEELAGLAYVREAMSLTSLPAFALGGITAANVAEAGAAGATRIAVSSAICGADEPRSVAGALRAALGP